MKIAGTTRLRTFNVNGYDMKIFVHEMKVHESLMRPFQTIEALIIDDQNIIDRAKFVGGESVEIMFDTIDMGNYETKLKVLSIENLQTLPSLKAQSYILNLVGESFFGNKNGKVQMAFKNISGAKAIEKLHNTYLAPSDASLEIFDSKGFIGEQVSYLVSNQFPFEAINDIRGRLTSDKFKTGAFAYYRDKDSYKLMPLEKMFSDMDIKYSFINDPTIGHEFGNLSRQYRNILSYKTGTSFNPSGKGSPADLMRLGKNVVTNITNVGEAYSKGQTKSPTNGAIQGSTVFSMFDSSSSTFNRTVRNILNDYKLNKISPIAEKIGSEQLYGKTIQDGPAVTISVLIEAGLQCTVGKGVNLKIQNGATNNQLNGNYIVINLCHHLKLWDVSPQGVTTLELARGGID